MSRLRAVTIDGTVIEADQFKEQSKGIKLERERAGGSERSKPETIGYVPFDRLMYVVPEEVRHKIDELEEVPDA